MTLDYPVLNTLEQGAGGLEWHEAAVPLEHRGVSRRWLMDFVGQLHREMNADRKRAAEEAKRAEDH
jgi:hypothetical protein